MDSLPRPFTIEVDGKPITKVNGTLDEVSPGGEACKHAKTGSEPAIFELEGCRLTSNGLVLSRAMIEDLSLMPKKVYWFQADDHPQTHHVIAHKDGDEYSLRMSNASFMQREDRIFASLLDDQAGNVTIKMQA